MNKDQEEYQMQSDTQMTVTQTKSEPGFWQEMWQQARLVYYLLRDPEVPFYLKALPLVGFVYVLVPFDFIADVLPFLGQLDDFTAVITTAKVFIELSPQDLVYKHMQKIREADGYVTAVDPNIVDAIIIDPDDIPQEKQPDELP